MVTVVRVFVEAKSQSSCYAVFFGTTSEVVGADVDANTIRTGAVAGAVITGVLSDTFLDIELW